MNASRWLLLAVLVALQACSGGLDKRELRLKATFTEDFDRGLPEFLAFSPGGKCLYHTEGFSTEEHFLQQMDRVLAGERIEQKASRLAPGDLEQRIRQSVNENASIPAEKKEEVIRVSLEQSLNPPPRCTHGLDYYTGRFESQDGDGFSLRALPEGKSLFIEFYADWCVPCKKQEQALERYALQRGDEFVLLKVERDKAKLLAR